MLKMNHLLPIFSLILALAPPVLQAQNTAIQNGEWAEYSAQGSDFEEFVARGCWVFTQGLEKADGLLDLKGTASVTEEGVVFSAESFDPASFDPRDFAIEYNANPQLPSNFRVGDRGVIQFHSTERCVTLFERHLAQKAKHK